MTGFEVFLRSSQCLMKGSTVSRVEPVARIEGQEINFCSLRELCRPSTKMRRGELICALDPPV
jgi:hypothetical protein